jgi:hypothetical protein
LSVTFNPLTTFSPYINSIKVGKQTGYFPLEFLQQAAKEVQGGVKNGELAKDFALQLADSICGSQRVGCTQKLISMLQPNNSLLENRFFLHAEPLKVLSKTFPQPQLLFDNSAHIQARNGSWSLRTAGGQRLCFQT